MFVRVKGSGAGTVRFAGVVKAAGKPHAVTLWTRPEANPQFMRAARGDRVLTIHQTNVGQRKDYGEVGFIEKPGAAYFVFPKSIKEFEGKRVIGINYDLLEEAPPRGPIARVQTARRVKRPKRRIERG